MSKQNYDVAGKLPQLKQLQGEKSVHSYGT